MPRIKVLQIIPTLDRCGAEKQMVLLAAHLPKDEFEVEVAALTRSGPYAEDLTNAAVPLTVIGKKFKLDPFAYFRLKNVIRRFKPDIVHTWLFAANAYGRYAAAACNVPHIIAAERCVDPWKSSYHFIIDKYLAAKTQVITTNSSGVKDFYVQHGLPADKFEVIPNAVEIPPSAAVKPSQQFPPSPCTLGVVARLWKQKRIDDLLWVFQTLDFMQMKFQAYIIGDGPERDALLRLRDGWKLSHCVHFLGARNDVAALMPQFDILLNCSAYEGQSNSILEAMSLQIPVVATDIPGNTDLVLDGETGFLVPDGGDDFRLRRRVFVAKIIELMENAGLRRRMGANARQRIEEHFTLQKMLARCADLYRRLLGDT